MTRLRDRLLAAALLVALLVGAGASRAHAAPRLDAWKGHIAFGYAKVFSDTLAPAGSLSVAGGVEYPLSGQWRLGPALSFNLLGSSSTRRGSVPAQLDYSLFEAALLLTYLPAHGPVARLSAGAGVASARAELSVAGGGAAFGDLTVGEVKPEFAIDATAMPRSMTIVAVGAEFGARFVPVTQGLWTMFTARLAIHF